MGDDRHLVQGLGEFEVIMEDGVAGFVVGGRLPLLLRDDEGFSRDAHQDLVPGFLEIAHLDDALVLARGEKRGLVHEVREICTRGSRGRPRYGLDVHLGGEGNLL